jgi:NDP-sugar pyrophosphorylase family protein
MVDVGGRPLLEIMLAWLQRNGVRQVVIGVAYMGDVIIQHFRRFDTKLDIEFSRHTVEGGTAEGFRLAIERYVTAPVFFAMNGDEITNVNLQDLAQFHASQGSIATMTVSPLPSPFGVVELEGSKIVAFHEKPRIQSVCVSVGVYVFQREILEYLPQTGDVERTVFPRLASERRISAYRHDGFWKTVNTAKDLREVEKELDKIFLIEPFR